MWYNIGVRALKAAQYSLAIDNFKRCAKVTKTACSCTRAVGIAYAKDGDSNRAAEFYQRYLRICPDAPDADEVRKHLADYGK